MEISQEAARCWQAYLATQNNPEEIQERFYEAFSIGDTAASKNEGARLILEGIKTTTSDLLWSYELGSLGPPQVGSLSILTDGADKPVCIVESIRLETKAFKTVDEQFAYDYGEWDRTLASWREHIWWYYSKYCQEMGWEASEDMPLVCEWLRVVYICGD